MKQCEVTEEFWSNWAVVSLLVLRKDFKISSHFREWKIDDYDVDFSDNEISFPKHDREQQGADSEEKKWNISECFMPRTSARLSSPQDIFALIKSDVLILFVFRQKLEAKKIPVESATKKNSRWDSWDLWSTADWVFVAIFTSEKYSKHTSNVFL